MKKLWPVLYFLTILGACTKELDDDPKRTCNLTRLDPLHNPWELAVVQWPDYLTTSRDCLDTLCSYFHLNLEDSSKYKMAYHLFVYKKDTLLQIIKGKETGFFQYDYCYSAPLYEPFRPFTNQGTMIFRPNNGQLRELEFTSDPKYPLWIYGEMIPNHGKRSYYFKI